MRSVAQQEKMPAAHPFQPPRSAHELRRRVSNIVAVLFTGIAIAFAVIVLLYLLFYVLRQGIPYINLDFLTKTPTPNGEPGGGVAEAIQGSLILVGLAALFKASSI